MNRAEADIPAVHRQESGNAFLGFLLIEHSELSSPIRVVSSPLDHTWDGATWVGAPFGFQLLTDTESMPETELVVQNLDRRIGNALRDMTERATVSLWVFVDSEFNNTVDPRTPIGTPTPLYEMLGYSLTSVDGDVLSIRGRVALRDFATEPFGKRATQRRCPGLFA